MKNARGIYFFIGLIFLMFGSFQILSSFSGISGFIVADGLEGPAGNVVGVYSIFLGFVFLMLSRRRKGQAAMEFLMTYGWAILAAIIAIGVLAYFGIFSVDPPTAIVLGFPFYGEGFAMDSSQGQFLVEVKNNVYDSTKRIKSYHLENSNLNCPAVTGADIPVQGGSTGVLTFRDCVGLNEGVKFKGDIIISYTDPGSSLEKISSGIISGELHETSGGAGGGGGQNDSDGDGVNDDVDNCININNTGQEDVDSDGVGDVCDNCVNVSNVGQEDLDNDQIGDVCDSETCGNSVREGSEGCDDGNQVSGDRCSSICQIEYYRVFVTSATYNGNLGGVSGADSKCQALVANISSLNGTWKAWISVLGNDASARLIHSSVEYRLVDNQTKVADDWNDLTDGTLDARINMSQLGQYVATSNVWTGTNITGTAISNNCILWTNSTLAVNGGRGLTSSVSSTWTVGSTSPCASSIRLYCFEQT